MIARALLVTGALVLIAVAVALIAAAVTPGPSGPRVRVANGSVVVEVRGPDMIWALKRRIEIPTSAIRDVRVADPRTIPKGMRLPGTHLPGVITAGFYGTGANRSFWDVRRSRRVLVLELEGFTYRRVVVEVPDPDAVAEQIRSAVSA